MTTNAFRVSFRSAGCLPESDPTYFFNLADLRAYLRDEWTTAAADEPAWNVDTFRNVDGVTWAMHGATCPNGHRSALAHRGGSQGFFTCPTCGVVYDEPTWDESAYMGDDDEVETWTSAALVAIAAIDAIDGDCIVSDPRAGSLYAWAVESVDEDDIVPNDEVARDYLTADGGAVPCSRYGRDSSACADVAIVAANVQADANGDAPTFRALDYLMGLVVNDADSVAELLAEHATDEQLDSIGADRDDALAWIHGDKEDARLAALRAFLIESGDYTADEVRDEDIDATRYDDTVFDAFGNEYRVLDDAEADDAVAEYVADSAWAFNASFLAAYMPEGIDAGEVESIRGDRCEDANAAIVALIKAGPSDLATMARDAANADGRGHFLAHYDHDEGEVEHAGRTWFVYRVN